MVGGERRNKAHFQSWRSYRVLFLGLYAKKKYRICVWRTLHFVATCMLQILCIHEKVHNIFQQPYGRAGGHYRYQNSAQTLCLGWSLR